jgi:DNA polymerase-3 subunit epsilon
VKLARQTWRLYPTKLPNVCNYLGIPLDHHNAASDAEACARIVLAARK